MDVSTATQDDSSGANPSSVKSDDSSPRQEGGCGSPPPNCAICLGTCRNKSFTDSCLHQFCFKCLLTWSKVKAECPLCKQNFRSIIHNVRSNHQYEEYMVEQRTEETEERIDIDNLTTTRRFRYRTTLTLPRRESIAIQQLLLHYPIMADVFPPPVPRASPARRRRSPTAFRRTVYRHNLWARPLPDFTGRHRDCTPEFYRYNNSQMHRLVPWINRELHYLLNENIGHISYVMTRIMELLPQHPINSPEFKEAMQRFFGERTEHFLHELYCFASTPYDMTGYDRYVQYTTDRRISTMVNEVLSSSDSDASVDSDILIISSSEPAEPPPGPSREPPPAPVYPLSYIPNPPANVIPIETISHSDTDDDSSEVMVVGYIKPPQDRTPEVVDLLGSDSDVVVQDTTPPEPSQSTASVEAPETRRVPIVKLSLKRHVPQRVPDSESEDSTYTPPAPRRRKRQRSYNTATTSDTCRSTPSPSYSPLPSPYSVQPIAVISQPWCDSTSSAESYYTPSNDSDTTEYNISDYTSSSSSSGRRKRRVKKKSKRKNRSENTEKKRSKKRNTSRSHHKRKRSSSKTDSLKDKKSKKKSGKDVKSSKKNNDTVPPPEETPAPAPIDPQPGPSGISIKASSSREKKRRINRENKRLKSVVNVMYKHSNDRSPTLNSYVNNISVPVSSENSQNACNPTDDKMEDEVPSTSQSEMKIETELRSHLDDKCRLDDDDSDPEDNLPLNLTMGMQFLRKNVWNSFCKELHSLVNMLGVKQEQTCAKQRGRNRTVSFT